LAAISRIWQAFWQQPRQWCWFLAGVALITGGFYYRILPASNIVLSQGIPWATLAIAVGCFCAVSFATWIWLVLQPEVSASRALERTCLSLMFASMLCVWACIGPIGGTFYAHGRFVRLAIWFASFGMLQIAWMREWDRHLKARLPQLWRERDAISWPDATLAATLAVFAAEMLTYLDRPYIQITPFALVLNIALLASAMIVMWAIVGRGLFAIALTALGYFVLSFANAMKLKNLYAGLQPGDQSYLGELLYFKEFFQPKALATLALVMAVVLGSLVWAWRRSKLRLSVPTRTRMFVAGLAAFLLSAGIPWFPGSKPVLLHLGIVEETWDSYMSVKRNGLLTELAMQLPESYVPTPSGYSAQEIARVLSHPASHVAAQGSPLAVQTDANDQVSLIIFFFEALTNPHDFGHALTREPTPNFLALQAAGPHGYAISPRLANGSAESEFELITGMSTGFLPPNSCAYKHFMKRATPSLVSILRQQANYRSTAVKCVTPGFYNFQEAYEHLQLDHFCYEQKFVAPTYDKFTTYISDNSFVDEMLRPLAQPPCLVVGENLGSHAPYHAHLMGDKPRFLVEPSNPAIDQIETYFQAISRTDDALGRMIELLKQRKDRVAMVVVGDHHPPLATDSRAYDVPAFQAPGPAGELFRHRVPFAIWKNFDDDLAAPATATEQPASQSSAQETYISMNFLALPLMREAGIQPQGLFAWLQPLYEQCPVVSRDLFYADGTVKTWDELSPEVQQMVQDYRLLQYDILLGENYSAEIWAKAVPAVPAAK
jgi:hypothetical protein